MSILATFLLSKIKQNFFFFFFVTESGGGGEKKQNKNKTKTSYKIIKNSKK